MNRNERRVLLVFALLFLLGSLFWIFKQPHPDRFSPPPPPQTTATPPAASPVPEPVVKKIEPAVYPSTRSAAPVASQPPAPPPIQLHKELIPKNIEIVRCYYGQEIATPGSTMGFDINGTGFTSEFEKMIQVDVENPGIHVRGLRLVTANQIHGEMVIGSDAKTAFVYPRVLIKNLPVFRAPEPYAVVRRGEVLTIMFISMEENGRAGRFRVITNLDDELAAQFRIDPSTTGLEISDLQLRLPYAVEGRLQIGAGVPPGEYGLVVTIASKEAYRRNGMIRIVRPNVGLNGFVQGMAAVEPYHRPGDVIQIYVQGSGLAPQDIQAINAKVDEYDMGKGSFTYISPTQLRLSFHVPRQTAPGSYSVTVTGLDGPSLYQKKNAFSIVPPNWIAGVQISPPVRPGQASLLKIVGRDMSREFSDSLKIDVDEPGISVTNIRHTNPSALAADIAVSSGVAPGDYWLHLTAGGKKINPPFGSIIKVEPQ